MTNSHHSLGNWLGQWPCILWLDVQYRRPPAANRRL